MQAARQLLDLDHPPTALVGGNNLATIGIMKTIRKRGLRVPKDVSIVGFDDFEWADCFEPRLTLVAQPPVGDRPARCLPAHGADRRAQVPRRTIHLDAAIVEREILRQAEMNTSARDPLLAMHGVVKSFGGAQALRGVDFDLGARRSPCAARRERRRQIDADEHPLRRHRAQSRRDRDRRRAGPFRDPRAAQAAGVATIFQELDLVPEPRRDRQSVSRSRIDAVGRARPRRDATRRARANSRRSASTSTSISRSANCRSAGDKSSRSPRP